MTTFMEKAAAFRRRWWFGLAGRLRRRSLLLGAIWVDGFYLNAWPAAGMALPLLALLTGLIFGIVHPAFHALQPPVVVFAQSLPLLAVAAALGALGAQFGLLLVLGYAAGEFLFTAPPFFQAHAPAGSLIFRREGPRVIADLLFLLLAVQPALVARALAGSIDGALRRFGKMTEALCWLITALAQGALVWGWVHAAPAALRLPWLWTRQWPQITFTDFWSFAALLPCLAAGFTLLRGALTVLARRRGLGPQAAALLAVLAAADAETAVRRPSALRAQLLAALLTAALLLGFVVSWGRALTMIAIVAGLYLARLTLLPRLPLWNAAMRRTPLLLRWLTAIAVTFAVAKGWMALPWSDVGRNATFGAFGAELGAIGVGLAVTLGAISVTGGKVRQRGGTLKCAASCRSRCSFTGSAASRPMRRVASTRPAAPAPTCGRHWRYWARRC